MSKVLYHLHIDAAKIPASLIEWATTDGGFHFDDFPHHFEVENELVEARHLTKYITAPATPADVKQECLHIQKISEQHSLQGFIQAEFIMDELEWNGANLALDEVSAPLFVKMRPLNPSLGENFKKHELHLEVNKKHTSETIIKALKGCGLHELDSSKDMTFTCSGHPRELLEIKSKLENFLNTYSKYVRAKMVFEATAFASLHNMRPQQLPAIVESIQ